MSDLLNFFADEASLLADKTLEHVLICALAIGIAIEIASASAEISMCSIVLSTSSDALSAKKFRRSLTSPASGLSPMA